MSQDDWWPPYVPVGVRRERGRKRVEKLRKKGLELKPVEIQGRTIARTFWGKAWCDHLESFSDYENRLPRGRYYVRNDMVCHLEITKGGIDALVTGTEIYSVRVSIDTLPGKTWKSVKERCSGQIGSLLELLQGKLSDNVMAVVTDREQGLFPTPDEILLGCSCPDWAVMCKHVAAVLYGTGARLDQDPQLLFLLRGVDHEELISAEVGVATATGKAKAGRKRIADGALSDVFGIEIEEDQPAAETKPPPRRKKTAPRKKAGPTKKAEPRKAATPGEKTASRKKAAPGKAPQSARKSRAVTGKTIARLRAKFELSQNEFATLLGVSDQTIGKWENSSGPLRLKPRSLDAFNEARELTKWEVWLRVGRL